jgi:hypothetical protein
MPLPMMKDSHLRTALLENLSAIYRNDPHTLIVEEMSLCEGRGRIDVAVVHATLDGFELKSDRDRLDRLARQSEIYGAVFDRMTLVVCPRLERAATRMIPGWWGIELTEPLAGGKVGLHTIRSPGMNPSPDALAIAELLWRDEALSVLIELGHAKGVLSKPRAHIHRRLAEVSELEFLQYRVRDRLRHRADWLLGPRN